MPSYEEMPLFPWDTPPDAAPPAPPVAEPTPTPPTVEVTEPAPVDPIAQDVTEDAVDFEPTTEPAPVERLGYVYGLDAEAYHAPKDELSVTGAKVLAFRTPKHFAQYRAEPVYKKAFDLGTAAHALALEGDASVYVEIPSEILASNGATSTKAAKEFIAAAREDGKIPLKAEEIETIHGMAAELRDHEAADFLLTDGTPEVSAFRRHESGLMLRARFDWLPEKRLILPDYKTTTDASTDAMQKTASRFRYFMQDAWYADMVAALDGTVAPSMMFIMQEKTAPYAVNILELDASARAYGRKMNELAIARYLHAQNTGNWKTGYVMPREPMPLSRFAELEAEGILENE